MRASVPLELPSSKGRVNRSRTHVRSQSPQRPLEALAHLDLRGLADWRCRDVGGRGSGDIFLLVAVRSIHFANQPANG